MEEAEEGPVNHAADFEAGLYDLSCLEDAPSPMPLAGGDDDNPFLDAHPGNGSFVLPPMPTGGGAPQMQAPAHSPEGVAASMHAPKKVHPTLKPEILNAYTT